MSATRGRPALRRRQVLALVKDTIATKGQAPSYGEISTALGIGTRTEVRRIVAALETLGQVRRTGKGRVRRISLT